MGKFIDLTGLKFGRLTVIKRAQDYYENTRNHEVQWYCDCDCGTKNIIVRSRNLRDGITKSCGCYKTERIKEKTKFNDFDLTNEFGIGYASNTNTPFYFDLEDYEKIKNIHWYENNKYIYAHYPNRYNKTSLHRFLLNSDSEQIDHINHNTLDNRKNNLREATYQQNGINKNMMTNNTSGFTGVYYDKARKKWVARIGFNGKDIYLGRFDTLEQAVRARKEGEEKYFKEWSYFNSTGKETYEN